MRSRKECSRSTMRSSSLSTTLLGTGAGDCAAAASAANRKTRYRIDRVSSGSKLKDDVDDGAGIDGRSFTAGRFEMNLPGGGRGGFIQAVTQSANHAENANFARGFEQYFEQHLAFD